MGGSTSGFKQVFLVRTDLSMTKGKIAAQCAHAAVMSFQRSLTSSRLRTMSSKWEAAGQPKVVLKVPSLEELRALVERAHVAGLCSAVVHDAGHTQVDPGTVTVAAIGPGPADAVDAITGHLKLL